MANNNWNEADHPRDEEGKFTYKNNVQPKEPFKLSAEFNVLQEPLEPRDLYKNTNVLSEKELEQKTYIAKLLDILGNKATPADILYPDSKRLEERIIEEGLENKLLKFQLKSRAIKRKDLKPDFSKPVPMHLGFNDTDSTDNDNFLLTNYESANANNKTRSNNQEEQNQEEQNQEEQEKESKSILKEKLTPKRIKEAQEERLDYDKIKNSYQLEKAYIDYKATTIPKLPPKGQWGKPLNSVIVTSPYNPARKHPKLGVIRAHKGVDLHASEGTPVLASFHGKVVRAAWLNGFGNTVVIEHTDALSEQKVYTLYAHLSSIQVKNGEYVDQGQQKRKIRFNGNIRRSTSAF